MRRGEDGGARGGGVVQEDQLFFSQEIKRIESSEGGGGLDNSDGPTCRGWEMYLTLVSEGGGRVC
jgi:hypothetical protein